jgi:hypothetical protein
MLLSRGELAYFGEAKQLTKYFSSIGYECPMYTNPADFALDLITVDTKDEQTQSVTLDRLKHIVGEFKKVGVPTTDEESAPVASRYETTGDRIGYVIRSLM